MFKKLLTCVIILWTQFTLAQTSILSEGNWHKIGVTTSGIYKINAEFLSTLGIDVNSLDPEKIKIYGSNGGMLPQSNAEFSYIDPPENALIPFLNDRPGMGAEEYLLFYAQGPDMKSIDADGEISYEKNIYSDTAYYFLTTDGVAGKRAQTASLAVENGTPINFYHDFITHESEETNLIGSGRKWLGNIFSNQTNLNQTYSYQIPGLKDSIKLYARLIAQSEEPSSFNLSLNDQGIGTVEIDAIQSGPGTTYTDRARGKEFSHILTKNTSENIDLSFSYNQADVSLSRGYLDYFILSFERDLALYGTSTRFTNINSTDGIFTYSVNIGLSSNVSIVDITDPTNIQIIDHTPVGSSAQFSINTSEIRTYMVFSGADFPNPVYFGTIGNQNLKSSSNYNGLIITSSLLESQAKRLQAFHEIHDQLKINVVNVGDIYNEFSSGKKDLSAIRNYIKYVFDNGGSLKYVLLMGDCSYDYKFTGSDPNHIPIYESRESFDPVYSYSSDDYLGFLDDDEGLWFENEQNDHDMEIGIGRIPAKSQEEAKIVVDKIIRYATSERSLGKWRNEIAYFADDGDNNIHMNHAVTLSNIVSAKAPEFRSKKIFLDNYEQISEPKERAPAATRALEDAIADGLLVLNFMGHGNEYQWMEEETLNNGVIDKLTNRHKMPLIVTATCEFGRYDHPIINSGAENLLLNPNGGAIALVTTTRPVYAHTNLKVNKAFHESLFTKKNNQYPRLGDIMRETKNNSLSGPVNRNFALLGDPFLRLNYPGYNISFKDLSSETDTLSALEKYTLYGAVTSGADTIETFNGKATITIIDIPQQLVTRGQENPKFYYEELSNALFRGDVTVKNGKFNASFILPKNISYKLKKGKILVYAWNDESFTDASGANENIIIGGTDPNPASDDLPPSIVSYINDESFISGETIGPNSLFIAKITDENGINISSNGFNQNISLTINGEKPININDFYTADLDTYQSGTILYPLQNLSPGKYTATLKIWDTYNNSIERTVNFNVSDQPRIRLYNVMNYPNPISLSNNFTTTFSFEHDRQGEELEVSLIVYDMSGSVKFESIFYVDDSLPKVDNLEWRPGNSNGAELQQGVYLYRLKVQSTLDGASNDSINRLIIIN